jgi:hypothetical protein
MRKKERELEKKVLFLYVLMILCVFVKVKDQEFELIDNRKQMIRLQELNSKLLEKIKLNDATARDLEVQNKELNDVLSQTTSKMHNLKDENQR